MKVHLVASEAMHRWIWVCSKCLVTICTTVRGERPAAYPEKCPCCGCNIVDDPADTLED